MAQRRTPPGPSSRSHSAGGGLGEEDLSLLFATNPGLLQDFPIAPCSSSSLSGPVAAAGDDEDAALLKATVAGLKLRIEELERQKGTVQVELSRARQFPARRDDEVEKLRVQLTFAGNEKIALQQATEALSRERDELKKQLAAANAASVKNEERPLKRIKEEVRPVAVKVESRPFARTDRIVAPKQEAKPVAPVIAPISPVVAPLPPHPSPAAPLAVAPQPQPPAQDWSLDAQQMLIKKLYAGSDIFELLQQQHSDKEELLRITRDLALRMGVMFGGGGNADGLALVLANFLFASPNERVSANALSVLGTLFGTVPQTRIQTVAAMTKLARTSVLPVLVTEAEPWCSLVSVLIGHVAQANCGETVRRLLLSCFQIVALNSAASSDALQAFLPLFSGTSEFAISLVNGSCIDCLPGVEFLCSVMRCPFVYAAARQARGDGASVLSSAAELLSREMGGKEEAVLALRRSLVKLFSIVVSCYEDWDSCTTTHFGPRLVNLLFELIGQLKRDSDNASLALAVGETFSLVLECNKRPSAGIGKVFHQLFICSLVALSSGTLHPSLAPLRAPAAALLREGQVEGASGYSSH